MGLDAGQPFVVYLLQIVVAVYLQPFGLVSVKFRGKTATYRERNGGVTILAQVVGRVKGKAQGTGTELCKTAAGGTAQRLVGLDIDAVKTLDKQIGAVQLLPGGVHILPGKRLLEGYRKGVAAAIYHRPLCNLFQRIIFAFKTVAVDFGGIHLTRKGIYVDILRNLFLPLCERLHREFQKLQLGAPVHGILPPRQGVGRVHGSGKFGIGFAKGLVYKVPQHQIGCAGLQRVGNLHPHGQIERYRVDFEVAVCGDIYRTQGLIYRDTTAHQSYHQSGRCCQ